MKQQITTNEQYRHIVYLLRTYRLVYNATRSSCYLALYNELIANLYDARTSGAFLVMALSSPSVVSLGDDCNDDTKIYNNTLLVA